MRERLHTFSKASAVPNASSVAKPCFRNPCTHTLRGPTFKALTHSVMKCRAETEWRRIQQHDGHGLAQSLQSATACASLLSIGSPMQTTSRRHRRPAAQLQRRGYRTRGTARDFGSLQQEHRGQPGTMQPRKTTAALQRPLLHRGGSRAGRAGRCRPSPSLMRGCRSEAPATTSALLPARCQGLAGTKSVRRSSPRSDRRATS
mmetsp:Transcript_103946/g.298741  ORF Transcript_103946/g.298741 Transcript_103946/m.298741 type:complete len:203 (-) Transcript_103946:1357-1965(-)